MAESSHEANADKIRPAQPAEEHAIRNSDLAPELPPGWTVPRDIVPHPTYWPMVMALGIVGLGFGIVTSVIISIVGLVLFFLALFGWMGDLSHEQHGTGH